MTPRLLVAAWTAILALSVCALTPGCSRAPEPEAVEPGRIVEYTVRGKVVDLYDDPVTGPTVRVHHEPIPSFESEGEVVGMPAMTMPFPLAEGVSTEGLAPDAIVEFSFRVHYSAESMLAESWELFKFDVLPPDTELIFNGDASGDPAPATEPEEAPESGS